MFTFFFLVALETTTYTRFLPYIYLDIFLTYRVMLIAISRINQMQMQEFLLLLKPLKRLLSGFYIYFAQSEAFIWKKICHR